MRTREGRRSIRGAFVSALNAAAVGLLVMGCSGPERVAAPIRVSERSGGSATSTTSTTSASETTVAAGVSSTAPAGSAAETSTTVAVPADPTRAAVEDAYLKAVKAFENAALIPSPDSPEIAMWTTGPMFEGWTKDLSAMRIQGRVGRFPADSKRRIEVESFALVSPTEATLETCQLDDGVVSEVATGRIVNDDVVTRRLRSILRLEAGSWRLAEREDAGEAAGLTCFA